jgi:hypothetical protein
MKALISTALAVFLIFCCTLAASHAADTEDPKENQTITLAKGLAALSYAKGLAAAKGATSGEKKPGSVTPEKPVKPDSEQPAAADDPLGTFAKMVAGVRSGKWRVAAALCLSLVMLGFNWLRKNVKWMKTRLAGDRAGAISLLALAVGGGLLTALSGSAPLDATMIAGAVWTAVEAAGFFLLVKKIWRPSDKGAQ